MNKRLSVLIFLASSVFVFADFPSQHGEEVLLKLAIRKNCCVSIYEEKLC
jgi:hypothetical protein